MKTPTTTEAPTAKAIGAVPASITELSAALNYLDSVLLLLDWAPLSLLPARAHMRVRWRAGHDHGGSSSWGDAPS
jgi:hypothetical protein